MLRTISIIERSRNVVRRFYCRECIRKKRNFAFKLDVDTLNESGGSGREFGIPWKRGRGREYSSEIKKIPKAKSRFRLKFLTSVSRSLEPVWIQDLIGSRNFCESSSRFRCKSRTPFHLEFPPTFFDARLISSFYAHRDTRFRTISVASYENWKRAVLRTWKARRYLTIGWKFRRDKNGLKRGWW